MDYSYYTEYYASLVFGLILWTVIGAAVTTLIYANKKRSKVAGALIGAAAGLVGGLFQAALFVLLALWLGIWFLLPKLDRICPNCGKVNASNATVCKYCNYALAPAVVGPAQPNAGSLPPRPAPIQNQATRASATTTLPGKDTIFISYRRDDSAEVTGRIYDTLTQHFGKEAIFKDVDSIPYGVDFRKHLKDVVGSCGALIAIIGDRWLTLADPDGTRRLDDPADYVRIEIESALQRDVPVIPLLVKGARMPKETELPPDLKDLAFRNGTMVRNDPDFHPDMDRLIRNLEQQLKSI